MVVILVIGNGNRNAQAAFIEYALRYPDRKYTKWTGIC